MKVHQGYKHGLEGAGPGPSTVPSDPSVRKTKEPPKDPTFASEGVRVSVSEEARRLAATSDKFDTAKVERLRGAIQDGTYQVDAECIARKLLDEGNG